MAIGPNGLGVGAQIAVVFPGCDRRDGDPLAVRVHLHQRHCAVLGDLRGEGGLEWLKPSAVVHDHVWLGPGSAGERGHAVVRDRDTCVYTPR